MGTRGYQAWRFRKRYYMKYNNHDSHPSGLGTWIARSIPLNPKDYATWLESQRRMIREWEAEFLEALMPTQKELDDKPCVDGMEDPSWFPPMNGSMIKWVYVLDLDREIFSIDNSVHLKLERVPHVNLVDALTDGILGGRDEFKIFALGYTPEAAVANPMDEPPVVNPRMVLDDYGNELAPKHQNLPRRIVSPKKIRDIPWRRRHGFVFRQNLFDSWSSRLQTPLAATLPLWTPDDLPFREIAFAILCLASGGKHVTLFPETSIKDNGGWGLIDSKSDGDTKKEFVSVLTTGAHLEGQAPGSAPEETVYWLEGVLVVLTSQLFRPQAVEEGISRIFGFLQGSRPKECVDAVLLSIEHVVLMHIKPNIEIQHTALLPLVVISNHFATGADNLFEWLVSQKEVAMEDGKNESPQCSPGTMLDHRDHGMLQGDFGTGYGSLHGQSGDIALHLSRSDIEGDATSTFFALTHLFEAAARRHMRFSRAQEGCLPTEMYAKILAYVTDHGTRHSCVDVSRTFRTLCQEDFIFADGVYLKPWKTDGSFAGSDNSPAWFEMYDVASSAVSKVKLRALGDSVRRRTEAGRWKVVVGDEVDRKSVLDGVLKVLPH